MTGLAQYRVSAVASLLVSSKRSAMTCIDEKTNRRMHIVIDGDLDTITPGEMFEVHGRWEIHNEYGRQLRCPLNGVKRVLATGHLIIPFLAERLPGMGMKRAEHLTSAFGSDIAQFLEDETKLFVIAEAINPNLSSYALVLAATIQSIWPKLKEEYAAYEWLEKHGVEDRSAARKLVSLFGAQTPQKLEANPYAMVGCLRWKKLDKIALQLRRTTMHNRREIAQRLVGAIDSVMLDVVVKGDTAIEKKLLPALVAKKLNVVEIDPLVEQAILLGVHNDAIIPLGEMWRSPGCGWMESDLARRLREMRSGDSAIALAVDLRAHIQQSVDAVGLSLYEEQLDAVESILKRPISLLTGGAGTGKTTTTWAVCEAWERLGGKIVIAALAGKAALKSSQVTGREAYTIFRLLNHMVPYHGSVTVDMNGDLQFLDNEEINPDEANGSSRRAPIKIDAATLLLVDEASMVDLGQWHRIVEKLPKGCRVLMVGDVGQLGPIGFGLVFHLLASNKQITSNLTVVRRNTSESGIPKVSQDLLAGRMPVFASYNGKGDGVNFIPVSAGQNPMLALQKVVVDFGGYSPDNHDLMVIAPTNDSKAETTASVSRINATFGGFDRNGVNLAMNDREHVRGYLGEYFAVGDPVIHNTNDYAMDLRNGSLGHVIAVDPNNRNVRVKFETGDEYNFNGSNLIDISLAYGITCHRSQGSEVKRVIVMVNDSHIVDPSWLYTAVTRAKEQCVIIGDIEVLEIILSRPLSWTTRTVCFNPEFD